MLIDTYDSLETINVGWGVICRSGSLLKRWRLLSASTAKSVGHLQARWDAAQLLDTSRINALGWHPTIQLGWCCLLRLVCRVRSMTYG